MYADRISDMNPQLGRKYAFMALLIIHSINLLADKIDPGGWDKIKWGMTLDAVADIYKGGAYRIAPSDPTYPNKLSINGIKIDFLDVQATVQANEQSHTVYSVALELPESSAFKRARSGRDIAFAKLRDLLIAKYGPPDSDHIYQDSTSATMSDVLWAFQSTSVKLSRRESAMADVGYVMVVYQKLEKNPL